MKIEEIKKIVDSVNFSKDAKLQLDSLLESALIRGDLSEQEKKFALEIVDKEIEKGKLDIDNLADVAMAFSEMADDVDMVEEIVSEDLSEIDDSLLK